MKPLQSLQGLMWRAVLVVFAASTAFHFILYVIAAYGDWIVVGVGVLLAVRVVAYVVERRRGW